VRELASLAARLTVEYCAPKLRGLPQSSKPQYRGQSLIHSLLPCPPWRSIGNLLGVGFKNLDRTESVLPGLMHPFRIRIVWARAALTPAIVTCEPASATDYYGVDLLCPPSFCHFSRVFGSHCLQEAGRRCRLPRAWLPSLSAAKRVPIHNGSGGYLCCRSRWQELITLESWAPVRWGRSYQGTNVLVHDHDASGRYFTRFSRALIIANL
jgi:hypothetical protein